MITFKYFFWIQTIFFSRGSVLLFCLSYLSIVPFYMSTHAYFYHLYRFCSEYFPPHSSTTIIHLFSLNYIGLSSLDDRCSNDKLQFVDKFVNGSLMHLLSRNNFRVSQTYTSSLSHCKLGTSVQHECTYVVPKHALRIIAAII